MAKEIPVILGKRQVFRMPSGSRISDVYDKLWRTFYIHKIYRAYTPSDRFILELKQRKKFLGGRTDHD